MQRPFRGSLVRMQRLSLVVPSRRLGELWLPGAHSVGRPTSDFGVSLQTFYLCRYASHARRNLQTHYDALGVAPSASRQDLKSAFYKLSMKYHPDKNPNNDKAHGRFIAINEAYNTLSDDIRRREYDRSLHVNDPFGPASHAATTPSGSSFKYHRRPATGSGHRYHPGRKATHRHHYASQDHQTQFDTEYRHHWSDAHLHSASQWYTRTQSWNRGHPPQSGPGRWTNPQATPENDGTQKAYTGATYTNVDDLPPSDYEIHMSRVRGVAKSMLIWASLLGTVAYALRFYEAHMVTEPRRKHSTTAPSSKS